MNLICTLDLQKNLPYAYLPKVVGRGNENCVFQLILMKRCSFDENFAGSGRHFQTNVPAMYLVLKTRRTSGMEQDPRRHCEDCRSTHNNNNSNKRIFQQDSLSIFTVLLVLRLQ